MTKYQVTATDFNSNDFATMKVITEWFKSETEARILTSRLLADPMVHEVSLVKYIFPKDENGKVNWSNVQAIQLFLSEEGQ